MILLLYWFKTQKEARKTPPFGSVPGSQSGPEENTKKPRDHATVWRGAQTRRPKRRTRAGERPKAPPLLLGVFPILALKNKSLLERQEVRQRKDRPLLPQVNITGYSTRISGRTANMKRSTEGTSIHGTSPLSSPPSERLHRCEKRLAALACSWACGRTHVMLQEWSSMRWWHAHQPVSLRWH